MKPTDKQIELAERLQKAGLCSGANYFIVSKTLTISGKKDTEFKEWFSPDVKNYKFDKHGKYKLIGPLPTFEEVWVELLKKMDSKKCTFELCKSSINIIFWVKSGKQSHVKSIAFDNIAEGIIEALLYLNENQ